jgi:hypothetical protein
LKTTFFTTILIVLLFSCGENLRSQESDYAVENKNANSDSAIQLNQLLTLADAEMILGETGFLEDSSTVTENKEHVTFRSAYTANEMDPVTKKTGKVYFLAEKFANESEAKKKYSFIKKANQNHEGVKVLDDLGDEAYFHSDGENFYFVMVRKESVVFNMKVNKKTQKTSLDGFNSVARKITNKLPQ